MLIKSYIVRERHSKSALSRNLILAVITISIVTTLTLTTIFTGGILSAHDHLALAQSVNDPQQHEENKETATSQDDHDDDEQISLSRVEKKENTR